MAQAKRPATSSRAGRADAPMREPGVTLGRAAGKSSIPSSARPVSKQGKPAGIIDNGLSFRRFYPK